MFYAISGFVFAYVYLSTNKKVSGKEFFVNRFARLYPLHFATLIIVSILQFINWGTENSFQIIHYNDFYHFILQLFFISSWGFEEGHSFNGPIWSVSIEIFIYGIFFLLLGFLKKFKLFLSLVICITLLLIYKLEFTDSLFLECGRLFFLGVLLYYLSKEIKFKFVLFLISIFCLIFSLIGNFKIYLFCPSMLLIFVLSEELIKGKKVQDFFRISGNLTYALYLIHIPVQLTILLIVKNFNFSDLIYFKTYFFFIFFGILITSAYFCFRFFENPMNKKIRKTLLRKS
jgi:peptidoglycan/LPS O-acetylase OafA/YrhL